MKPSSMKRAPRSSARARAVGADVIEMPEVHRARSSEAEGERPRNRQLEGHAQAAEKPVGETRIDAERQGLAADGRDAATQCAPVPVRCSSRPWMAAPPRGGRAARRKRT